MNPVLRQRIPPNIRTLLTDIRPREQHHCSKWTDAEPGTITRGGIELPARGSVSQGELLSPATDDGKECASSDNACVETRRPLCGLCLSQLSCYTCPRCNVPYCSLLCYRSTNHSVCSEEFYKESVMRELKDTNETESQGKRRMQEILLKLRHAPDGAEGGTCGMKEMEDGWDDAEGEGEETTQALELLSRLAEIQSTGGGSPEEIEDILSRLKEIGEPGEGEADGNSNEGSEDEEKLDLVDRLSGLDIQTVSEEALWERLTSQEKDQFLSLVKGGTVGALVPQWKPWWEEHEEGERGETLVELLEEDSSDLEGGVSAVEGGICGGEVEDTRGQEKVLNEQKRRSESQKVKWADELSESGGQLVTEEGDGTPNGKRNVVSSVLRSKPTTGVPPVNLEIPPLSSLSSNPSPLVCYGLVNVLFGYTFALRLFNGDLEPDVTQEFCQTILAVSESLSSGRVFNSVQEALEGGQAALLAGGYFDQEDPGAGDRALEAVAHIMSGRSSQDTFGYCLAALSQLSSALSQARAALPKRGRDGETRRKYFLAMKKCDFFQAWVSENGQQLSRLAAELWREQRKRESGRKALEGEKKRVEERWKKGRGKGVLIEEIC
ncbi:zinc finger HIT domain-containing protein 2 [Osmerus eperlanus]|uniref:zinc finger HIT domain-containing protein 2 n=1 Tax=Osmerus eperlanus TaxID=29151 RepID=UPI002E145EB0